jgi:hypothetical protein
MRRFQCASRRLVTEASARPVYSLFSTVIHFLNHAPLFPDRPVFSFHRMWPPEHPKCYSFHLMDTGNDPRTRAKCHFVLLCFALDDRESLDHIATKWDPEITGRPTGRWPTAVLVGTKRDVWDPSAPGAVAQSDIDKVANEIRNHGFVEQSLFFAPRSKTRLSGRSATNLLASARRTYATSRKASAICNFQAK